MPVTLTQVVAIGGTVGAAVLGVIKAFPALKSVYESLNKDKGQRKAQPKLAIILVNGSRSRMRKNDHIYVPFAHQPGEAFDFEQQKLLQFDWTITWRLTLNITNQTESVGYKAKLIPVEEQGLTFNINPPIDFTKTFIHGNQATYDVTCSRTYRGTGEEVDDIMHGYPFYQLRLEYTNVHDLKYSTLYFPSETEGTKRNIYRAV